MTPRPMYPADGRKLPDVYTAARRSCATSCSAQLGPFPLFNFWGPRADIASSQWIADCARRRLATRSKPTLTLVYLPHLDYDLQRLGPGRPARRAATLRAIDAVCGELIAHRAKRRRARHRAVGVRHHAGDAARCTSTARCARPGSLRVRDELGPRAARRRRVARRSPSPITRSRTSTCKRPERIAEVAGAARAARRASSACSTTPASARSASITRARASSSPIARADRWFTLLLLARRRARARLRAHRRHPPQARLRPGRAVPRSGDRAAEARRRLEARADASSASARCWT